MYRYPIFQSTCTSMYTQNSWLDPPISGTSQLKFSSLAERPLAVAPASSGRCPATFLKALNSCPSRNIVFGQPEMS